MLLQESRQRDDSLPRQDSTALDLGVCVREWPVALFSGVRGIAAPTDDRIVLLLSCGLRRRGFARSRHDDVACEWQIARCQSSVGYLTEDHDDHAAVLAEAMIQMNQCDL